MQVRELINWLNEFKGLSDDTEIEVATCGSKDEWYDVAELEVTTNFRGHTVLVIHTD